MLRERSNVILPCVEQVVRNGKEPSFIYSFMYVRMSQLPGEPQSAWWAPLLGCHKRPGVLHRTRFRGHAVTPHLRGPGASVKALLARLRRSPKTYGPQSTMGRASASSAGGTPSCDHLRRLLLMSQALTPRGETLKSESSGRPRRT